MARARSRTTATAAERATRSPVRTAAMAVGAVFLLVGILGFIPGITQNFATITFADPDSEAKLLGLFEVNILHNIVHLLFGIIGLAAARARKTSRDFLVWGGVIYLGLWIYGMVIDHESPANLVSLNTADNWLHFGLGVGMLALGTLLRRADRGRVGLT